MENNEYKVVNIRDYLIDDDEKIGEESLRKKLSDFTCPLNLNVEEFLKQKSIEFVNKEFGLDLKWISKSSKFNQDDISDSILIAYSYFINTQRVFISHNL